MRKRLRVGVLGGGLNSAVGFAHISAMRIARGIDIVGACFSRNPNINRKSFESYSLTTAAIAEGFDEFFDWADRERPDLLIVLTPTNQHYVQAKAFSSLKIPILVEKALTTSFSEAADLKKTYSDAGIFNSVVFNYTGYPMLRELKAMAARWSQEDFIGFRIEMPQDSFIKHNKENDFVHPQDWRRQDYRIPTISLDLGVHMYSLVQFITNSRILEAGEIKSDHRTLGKVRGVVDDVQISSSINGVYLDLWFSKIALGFKNGLKLTVLGKHQSLTWIQEEPDNLYVSDGMGVRTLVRRGDFNLLIANEQRYTRFKGGHPTGFVEALANYYEDIISQVLTQKGEEYDLLGSSQKIFDFEEAADGLSFFEAAFTRYR